VVTRLTDDELRDVLSRAEEIQRGSMQGGDWNPEVAAVIAAAEEIGLSRTAVVRALRERLNLAASPPAPGDLVWARSVDEKFYPAEVVAVREDGVRVRFLRGSEHDVTPDQLRPCSIVPGERVVVHWPWWGPWTCTVLAYDATKQRVKLTDGWGYTKSFPLSEVWLAPARADPAAARKRVYATLLGAGAGVGAILGSIITALLMR
jgi:hypothetical protein